jgi:hypothetical protein
LRQSSVIRVQAFELEGGGCASRIFIRAFRSLTSRGHIQRATRVREPRVFLSPEP